MIDHIGVAVTDLDKSIAFYTKALAPLGYTLIMQFPEAAGFGIPGKPDFWIGKSDAKHPVHVAFRATGRAQVRDFYAAALAAGGKDTLLRALVKVPDIRWIRPFYLYPQQVTDDLLDLYAGEEKITKYIDMPLQHINDRMLKRMHRLGNRAAIEKLVDRMRTRIPGVTFRTAFIVGFPGETEKAYQELKSYVAESGFDRVAAFLYSDEEDTTAVALDDKI